MTMTWQNGRELATLTKDGKTINYSYNADGIRTEKNNNGVVTKYFYDSNNNLTSLICGDTQLVFYYDVDGQADSFIVYSGDTATRYYYVKNLQGDITKIMLSDGTVVANYYYDAYGEILSITDADGEEITDTSLVAFLNPLRYRGYVYDNDTGLYYLQSRYYDSTTKRFINADDTNNICNLGSLLRCNLYMYCGNNPCNRSDPSGCNYYDDFWSFANALPIVKGVTKFAGFSWDRQQRIWYSNMNPIQRRLGYCDAYNKLAPLAGIHIANKKMPFDYDGKSWMVWLWKGKYGITTGAEIGLYVFSRYITALGVKQKFYRCANDSERINMSFTLYKNGKKLFSRGYQKHWWLTGFKPNVNSSSNQLSMYITLGFKSVNMAKAFRNANRLGSGQSAKVSFWW